MRLKIMIPLMLLWAAVLYLGASFIFWDLNPAKWEQVVRSISVLLLLIGIIVTTAVEKEKEPENKNEEL